MEYLRIGLSAIFSLLILFALTKLMGNKQISQMSMFDYVIGITIGSIAAEMATNLEYNPLLPGLALVVYAVVDFGISVLTNRSLFWRKIITGRSLILLDNGELYRQNFKKARLDLNDFLTLCRVAGYFDITQLQTAVLEHNGNLSFLPKAAYRPATPGDLQLPVQQEHLMTSLILDGHVLKKHLSMVGKDEQWLRKQLKESGFSDPKQVYFAFCDNNSKLTAFSMKTKSNVVDKFE